MSLQFWVSPREATLTTNGDVALFFGLFLMTATVHGLFGGSSDSSAYLAYVYSSLWVVFCEQRKGLAKMDGTGFWTGGGLRGDACRYLINVIVLIN